MYIMAPEPISTAYFINPSNQCVCLYVYPPVVVRQRFLKNVTEVTNTRNNRIVGRVTFYAVRVLSKESRRLVVHRTYYLQEDYNTVSDLRSESSSLEFGANHNVQVRFTGALYRKFSHVYLHVDQNHILFITTSFGRAIVQALSRRLPTAAARVQTRVWSCGIL
jgi:hypothetical protein